MTTNILATAIALSDEDLLGRIGALAATERQATVELVAHLAALELRPSLYAAEGYGSLFAYCTQALRLSEDAACNRIDAARVCRRFPVVLDLLASGAISLSTIRLLKPHLTTANHQTVLERATGRTRKQIEALVAELAPQPDVAASVRKLPAPKPIESRSPESDLFMVEQSGPAETPTPSVPPASLLSSIAAGLPSSRPIIRAAAPERYRVQFTIDEATHEKLRRVQALLRREIPNGDPGLIFGQALDLLLAKVEKAKLGAAARAVWRRDAGQCAFVADGGRRCAERNFLELHHIHPYALNGPATVGNIALRCRRHNQYEAELVFGASRPSTATPP